MIFYAIFSVPFGTGTAFPFPLFPNYWQVVFVARKEYQILESISPTRATSDRATPIHILSIGESVPV
jgi:hypothetical protein